MLSEAITPLCLHVTLYSYFNLFDSFYLVQNIFLNLLMMHTHTCMHTHTHHYGFPLLSAILV